MASPLLDAMETAGNPALKRPGGDAPATDAPARADGVMARPLFREKVCDGAREGAEHLLFPFAERMDDVAWICSGEDGYFVYLNPAFERVYGVSRREAYADPGVVRRMVHPDDAAPVARAGQALLNGTGNVEFRIRRRDGSVRWLLDRSFEIRDVSGERMYAGVTEDITESKEAHQNRLDAAVAQRDALVREVHHRIKNNLQGITGMLRQLAASHPELREAMAQAIAQVQTVAVIHGLQSRAVNDRVRLCELVSSIASHVESLLRTRVAVEVGVNRISAAWICEAEAVAVALVLNELVFNAVKHCPSRAGAPTGVTVGGTGDQAQVRIVNPGRLPEGFDFRRQRGVGVGLRLVGSLLPRQGARLSIRDCAEGVETLLVLDRPVIAAFTARWEVS